MKPSIENIQCFD